MERCLLYRFVSNSAAAAVGSSGVRHPAVRSLPTYLVERVGKIGTYYLGRTSGVVSDSYFHFSSNDDGGLIIR